MQQVSEITLSQDQQRAVDGVVSRLASGGKLVTLGGYAGTGKTTTVAAAVPILRENGFKNIAFACYTGRAAKVLEKKLKEFGTMDQNDYCGTLHSLLYNPNVSVVRKEDGTEDKKLVVKFQDKERRAVGAFDLVVVDEASMVDGRIVKRLEEYGAPVLAVGDHGQLPPVLGSFSLMENPDFRLEKIHRQAENDPIIKASMLAREEGDIPVGDFGSVSKTRAPEAFGSVNPKETLVICGPNKTRAKINAWARRALGFGTTEPLKGERVICLRNNHEAGVMNGMMGTLERVKESGAHWWLCRIAMEAGFTYEGLVFRHQFGKERTLTETAKEAPDLDPDGFMDLFDWGWCLTVHKAQGTESDSVCVVEEPGWRSWCEKRGMWRRWLYTALTRAKKRLLVYETF